MTHRRQALHLALLPWLLALTTGHGARAATPESDHWFIFLERGRKTPDDRAAVEAMQRGHIDNFKRLFALGASFRACRPAAAAPGCAGT